MTSRFRVALIEQRFSERGQDAVRHEGVLSGVGKSALGMARVQGCERNQENCRA